MKKLIKNGRSLKVFPDGRVFRCAFVGTRERSYPEKEIHGTPVKNGYLQTGLHFNGKYKMFLIHRLVAEAYLPDWDESLEVDHIDGNPINNHSNNLRMVSHLENSRAFKKPRGKSAFRGVSWIQKIKRWRACITVPGKKVYLGQFINEKEAALAYNNKAKELGWPKECLNAV